MLNFETALISEIIGNINNNYTDNHDHYRFGPLTPPKITFKSVIRKPVIKLLQKRDFHKQLDKSNSQLICVLKDIDQFVPGLRVLYEILADEESKSILVKLITYHILGRTKVKLPLNTKEYWDGIKATEKITDFGQSIPIRMMSWNLYLIDLHKINIPLKLFFFPPAVYVDFILKQYQYTTNNKIIKANKGDYVIDAGGCYGDTALFFANETGADGKVYTYEFIPSNLDILYKNLALNPILQQRISVIENSVWEESGVNMSYIDNGPGSMVFIENTENQDGETTSLSIDDLVERHQIPKIDFIKMDIEGAELYALKGALKTIRKFRPKLAIAIYHSWDDFTNIPAFISKLDLGYKLFLGHYTIHTEETIIFAEVPNYD